MMHVARWNSYANITTKEGQDDRGGEVCCTQVNVARHVF